MIVVDIMCNYIEGYKWLKINKHDEEMQSFLNLDQCFNHRGS